MPPAAAHAMSSISLPRGAVPSGRGAAPSLGPTKLAPLPAVAEKTADFNKILGALGGTAANPAAFSAAKAQTPAIAAAEAAPPPPGGTIAPLTLAPVKATPKSASTAKPSDPKVAETSVVAPAPEIVPAVRTDPPVPVAAAGPDTEAPVPPRKGTIAPLSLAPVKAAPKSAPAAKSIDPKAGEASVVAVAPEIVPAVYADLPVPVAPAVITTALVAAAPVAGHGSAVTGTREPPARHDGSTPTAVSFVPLAQAVAKASPPPGATAPPETPVTAAAPRLPSSVVALHAQPQSQAVSVVAAHAPAMQLAPAIVSIGAAAGKDGQHSVTVLLAPIELGKVQITLVRDSSGATTITVSADRSDTLALLSHDQQALQHSLDQAGVSTEGRSLSFNLSGQREGGGGSADTRHAAGSSRSASGQFVEGDDAAEPVAGSIPQFRVGLINITV